MQYIGVAGTCIQVISMDGQDLNGPDVIRNQWIPVGIGQRYDVLFTMPEQGQVQVSSREEANWRITLGDSAIPPQVSDAAPVFDFSSYGTPKEDGITPEMKFDRTYNFVLGPLDINGKQSHEILPVIVKEGEWIKLRFEHRLDAEHPMHLHGHLFKILTKNGKPLTGSPIYADSVLLFKGDI